MSDYKWIPYGYDPDLSSPLELAVFTEFGLSETELDEVLSSRVVGLWLPDREDIRKLLPFVEADSLGVPDDVFLRAYKVLKQHGEKIKYADSLEAAEDDFASYEVYRLDGHTVVMVDVARRDQIIYVKADDTEWFEHFVESCYFE